MTNVFSYFGIQDVHDLADRVLKGDANDLGGRAKMCTQTAQTVHDAQRQAREIAAQAEAAGRALDTALHGVQIAMDAMMGGGAVGWVVKKATGVDIDAEGRKLLMAAIRPIYETALGLLARMEQVIRDYEKVLLDQAAILRDMPGIVRTDLSYSRRC